MTQGVEVPSDTNDKIYHVFLNRENTTVPNHCSCQGWTMARNKQAKKDGLSAAGITAKDLPSWCKHCQRVFDSTCQWVLPDGEMVRLDGDCPSCGGPTHVDGVELTTDVAEQEHDLASMLAELKGEAPLPAYKAPKPQPYKVDLVDLVEFSGAEGEGFTVLINDIEVLRLDLSKTNKDGDGSTLIVFAPSGVMEYSRNIPLPGRITGDKVGASSDPNDVASELLKGIRK